jgi:pimeloyl-ACP methyl ester carboxylesterase
VSKRTTPGGAVKVALGAGALLAAAWAATRVVNHVSTGKLDSYTNDPIRDYDSALARFAQVQAGEEKADQAINPVCHSKLLAHGHKVERAIVLMHGMTNCPRQFVELAPLFFERGYNVLIPRMPHSGLANLDTDALKYVTATELRDCSNTFVDIARGLGDHVTYVGISVGGLMGAWVAQYRADVNKAVMIAPAFTFSRGLDVGLSRFAMHLFLLLPNIMTRRFRPFKGGPPHNYHGFATRGLGQMMRLGFYVYDAARTIKPAAQSVLVITNAADPAVENSITRRLVGRWRADGYDHVETYEFDAKYQLIHDVIDPTQPHQQTALVYPVLLDLITR